MWLSPLITTICGLKQLTGKKKSQSTRFKSQFCRGLLPLLKISHSVAPKLHLSHSKVRLSEVSSNSGATQGILSRITAQKRHIT